MKNQIVVKWSATIALGLFPLLAGCLRQAASSQTETAALVKDGETNNIVATAPVEQPTATTIDDDADVSDAPVTPLQFEPVAALDVIISGPLEEVLKLAESQATESELIAFVNNSSSPFNLRSEEIVYLNDIGVPAPVITAMLHRDHMLRGASFAAGSAPLDSANPIPQTSPLPAEYSFSGYTPPSVQQFSPGYASAEPAPQYPEESAPALVETGEAAPNAVFYDALAPYGDWMEVQGEGPCWRPSVVVINSSWQPYCDRGNWVYTDCGWYWKSDYSWGWAAFHYGRWFRHAQLGWCWKPENVWGPSWVSWRKYGNYCGWAPLPPAAGFRASTGLTFHGRHADDHCDFGIAPGSYRFVEMQHLVSAHVNAHLLPHDQATHVFDHSENSNKIVSNHRVVFNHGLSHNDVAAATHEPLNKVNLHDIDPNFVGPVRERVEGNGSSIAVFKPNLSNNSHTKPAFVGPTRLASPIIAEKAPTHANPRPTSRETTSIAPIERLPGRTTTRPSMSQLAEDRIAVREPQQNSSSAAFNSQPTTSNKLITDFLNNRANNRNVTSANRDLSNRNVPNANSLNRNMVDRNTAIQNDSRNTSKHPTITTSRLPSGRQSFQANMRQQDLDGSNETVPFNRVSNSRREPDPVVAQPPVRSQFQPTREVRQNPTLVQNVPGPPAPQPHAQPAAPPPASHAEPAHPSAPPPASHAAPAPTTSHSTNDRRR